MFSRNADRPDDRRVVPTSVPTPQGVRDVSVQGATPVGPPPAASVPSDLSLLARADRLEGTIKVAGTFRVQGTLQGSVEATTVHIDEGASVKADITADEVVIGGEYNGKLVCRQRLEIRATGVVVGQVQTFRLMLHEGGSIDGELKMLKQPLPEDASVRGGARGGREPGARSTPTAIGVGNGQPAPGVEAVAAAGAEPIG
jgi:cytoskeletal protein CcmA (bactofilin family)